MSAGVRRFIRNMIMLEAGGDTSPVDLHFATVSDMVEHVAEGGSIAVTEPTGNQVAAVEALPAAPAASPIKDLADTDYETAVQYFEGNKDTLVEYEKFLVNARSGDGGLEKLDEIATQAIAADAGKFPIYQILASSLIKPPGTANVVFQDVLTSVAQLATIRASFSMGLNTLGFKTVVEGGRRAGFAVIGEKVYYISSAIYEILELICESSSTPSKAGELLTRGALPSNPFSSAADNVKAMGAQAQAAARDAAAQPVKESLRRKRHLSFLLKEASISALEPAVEKALEDLLGTGIKKVSGSALEKIIASLAETNETAYENLLSIIYSNIKNAADEEGTTILGTKELSDFIRKNSQKIFTPSVIQDIGRKILNAVRERAFESASLQFAEIASGRMEESAASGLAKAALESLTDTEKFGSMGTLDKKIILRALADVYSQADSAENISKDDIPYLVKGYVDSMITAPFENASNIARGGKTFSTEVEALNKGEEIFTEASNAWADVNNVNSLNINYEFNEIPFEMRTREGEILNVVAREAATIKIGDKYIPAFQVLVREASSGKFSQRLMPCDQFIDGVMESFDSVSRNSFYIDEIFRKNVEETVDMVAPALSEESYANTAEQWAGSLADAFESGKKSGLDVIKGGVQRAAGAKIGFIELPAAAWRAFKSELAKVPSRTNADAVGTAFGSFIADSMTTAAKASFEGLQSVFSAKFGKWLVKQGVFAAAPYALKLALNYFYILTVKNDDLAAFAITFEHIKEKGTYLKAADNADAVAARIRALYGTVGSLVGSGALYSPATSESVADNWKKMADNIRAAASKIPDDASIQKESLLVRSIIREILMRS